jgi:uncharacterized protein
MEPQERDLITTLLTRLKDASGQPKDSEADALIRQAMTQMPDAPYYLVQTVLIQDLSLHNAQNRIADLERQVATLSAPPQRTSFLGGLLGGGSQPAAGSAPQSGPWTRAPQAPPPGYAQGGYAQPGYAQPGYAQPGAAPAGGVFGGGAGGGSFLRSAAATAAGVAGGALLFEGISSLFGHSYASGLGGFGGGMGGMGSGLGETVINNNYYGDQGGGGDGGGYSGGDSGGDGGGAWGGGDGGYSGGGSDGGSDGSSWDSGDSGGGSDSDSGGSSSC